MSLRILLAFFALVTSQALLTTGAASAEKAEKALADEPPAEKAPAEKPPIDKKVKPAQKPKAKRTRGPFDAERFSWAVINPQRHEWVGDPISLSLRDADLVEVLRSFAKLTEANVVIDPSVQGKVTLELKEVPWDQALYVILKSSGLGMEITGNVWNMLPSEKLYKD